MRTTISVFAHILLLGSASVHEVGEAVKTREKLCLFGATFVHSSPPWLILRCVFYPPSPGYVNVFFSSRDFSVIMPPLQSCFFLVLYSWRSLFIYSKCVVHLALIKRCFLSMFYHSPNQCPSVCTNIYLKWTIYLYKSVEVRLSTKQPFNIVIMLLFHVTTRVQQE